VKRCKTKSRNTKRQIGKSKRKKEKLKKSTINRRFSKTPMTLPRGKKGEKIKKNSGKVGERRGEKRSDYQTKKKK